MTLLRVRSISKSYPGVQALAGVDLSVDAGEVHALLGQNGAGKSTLMKILAGSESPDAGSVELDGEEISLGSPERARDHGFGIVYQELSLVPQLSIAENVLMARWRSGRFGWLIGWKETTAEAERHLRRVGFDTDPKRAVSELGMAERQLVELAKALSTGPRVLLLDEPTSALSDREAPRLFEIIRDLTGQGVAVIYVSHRLQELVTISDRVSVLRDGELVDTVKTSDVDEAKLARMMVGRATTLMTESATGRERRPRGVPALRAAGLSRAASAQGRRPRGRRRRGRDRLRPRGGGSQPARQDAVRPRAGDRGQPRDPGRAVHRQVARGRHQGRDGVRRRGPPRRPRSQDERRVEHHARVLRRRLPRPAAQLRRGAGRGQRSRSRTCPSAPPRSTRRCRPCRAGTSRRSCSRAGRAREPACCCSTTPPRASTWPRRKRSSDSSGGSRTRVPRCCT